MLAYTLHENNRIIVSDVSSNLGHLYLLFDDEGKYTAGSEFDVLEHHLVLLANILLNSHNQYYGIIPIEQQQQTL